MYSYSQGGGASTNQKGRAAELRTYTKGKERQQLNHIVHSGDVNPHKHGYNPFADKNNKYDKKAAKVIKAAKAKK